MLFLSLHASPPQHSCSKLSLQGQTLLDLFNVKCKLLRFPILRPAISMTWRTPSICSIDNALFGARFPHIPLCEVTLSVHGFCPLLQWIAWTRRAPTTVCVWTGSVCAARAGAGWAASCPVPSAPSSAAGTAPTWPTRGSAPATPTGWAPTAPLVRKTGFPHFAITYFV